MERARSRKDEHIEHYVNKYAEKYPFWVLAEVLDFSDVSRLYAGLLFEHQREIAEGFGLVFTQDGLPKRVREKLPKGHPLAGWLHQLSIVRNACAHHVRLWNKSFLPASTGAMRTLPVFAKLPAGQSERVFGALLVMAQLLWVASPGTSWPDKVADHISSSFLTNSLANPRSMGLPAEWDGKL